MQKSRRPVEIPAVGHPHRLLHRGVGALQRHPKHHFGVHLHIGRILHRSHAHRVALDAGLEAVGGDSIVVQLDLGQRLAFPWGRRLAAG